jgi:AraC family transcriptional regulator of arabinose operon
LKGTFTEKHGLSTGAGVGRPRMNRLYFAENDPRFDEGVRLLGVGLHERMPPGFVTRRQGLPAFLFVWFHDAVEVELAGRGQVVAAETPVLWDRGRPHHFGHATAQWDHSWIIFGGREPERAMRGLRGALCERPLAAGRSPAVLDYVGRLLREFTEFERPDLPVVAGLLQLLLRELQRAENVLDSAARWHDPIAAARRFIASHLDRPLTVAAIASAAGLSASRLQELFRAELGQSVMQLVERQRLQQARHWLGHAGLRIAEVAARVGYDDAFYFSRRFRRAFGQCPRAYRRRLQGADDDDARPRGPARQ